MKKNILIFTDYYLPGFRSGGLIRSLVAVVEALKNHATITIVTRNHDCGVDIPYDDIAFDVMSELNGCHILYLSNENILRGIFFLLKNEKFDLVYMNSFFSPLFTVYPLFLLRFFFNKKSKILLAPRGELALGSLAIKKHRKKYFLIFRKFFQPTQNIFWHATSSEEKKDIEKKVGVHEKIIALTDIALHSPSKTVFLSKEKNKLKIIFISRITEIKNVDYALTVLMRVSGKVEFDIYGPIESSDYWVRCLSIIERLPENIIVNYRGELEYHQVMETLRHYDLFLLPTKNENYCHAIVEALSTGCPVMISTQTPWHHLASFSAGWSFDLLYPEAFSEKINALIPLDEESYRQYHEGALRYFEQQINNEHLVEEYKRYFL